MRFSQLRSGMLLAPVVEAPGGGGNPPAEPVIEARAPGIEPKKEPVAPATPALTPELSNELVALRKLKDDAGLLLRADTDPNVRTEAMQRLMASTGYTAEQIQDYIARATPQADPTGRGEPNLVEAAILQNQAETRQVRVTQLRGMLDSGVQEVLVDPKGVVSVLLGDLKKFRGDEMATKVQPVILEEIKRETLERLKVRKASGRGEFQDGWIREEAQAAAKAVSEKYRTVIGDVSLIGASPETVSGEDEFLKSTPVQAPVFKSGMNMGDAQTAVRQFNTDAFSRLALEAGGDGRNRA